jgi:two-component system NtrC family sensor kinase
LVTGIAHEINTPVGIGVTAITMLQDSIESLLDSHRNKKLKLAEFEAKLLNIQSGAALVFNNLIKSADLINTFKKVSVDQMSEQRRTFDLGSYIQEITSGLQSKLASKSISLSVDIIDEVRIDSYPGAVAQVVTNLVLNAFIHGFDEDSLQDAENREITIAIQGT